MSALPLYRVQAWLRHIVLCGPTVAQCSNWQLSDRILTLTDFNTTLTQSTHLSAQAQTNTQSEPRQQPDTLDSLAPAQWIVNRNLSQSGRIFSLHFLYYLFTVAKWTVDILIVDRVAQTTFIRNSYNLWKTKLDETEQFQSQWSHSPVDTCDFSVSSLEWS